MAAVDLSSIGIAPESSYGSVDSTTGIPDNSGLTFSALDFDRANAAGLYGNLDEPAAPAIEARTAFGEAVSEPVTMWQSGAPVQRLAGTLEVSGHIIGVGDGSVVADHGDLPLAMILRSMLGGQMPNAASDAITGVSSSTFTPTTATNYFEGMLVAVSINGRREIARVTDVDTGTPLITVAPAFSADPGSQTARLMTTFFPDEELPRWITGARGSESASTATSFALRGDIGIGSDARRVEAFGCRAERLRIFGDESRVIGYEATIRTPYATDDGLTAALQQPIWGANARPNKAVYLGALATLSDDISGGSVGGTLARSTINLRNGWELVIEGTQSARDVNGETILGQSESEIVGVNIRFNCQADSTTTFEEMRRLVERRMLTIGSGPDLPGCGIGIQLPAAHLIEYARPTEVDSRFALSLSFAADQFGLDDRTTGYADNRVLAIGLAR